MNSANYAKTWLADRLNRFAENKASAAIQATGRALPCSVTVVVSSGIVTVQFEVQSSVWSSLPPVTIPKAGTEWMRYPTQVGDKGYVVPADAYLGGVSGLGGGVADLRQSGNLSSLVFVPLGSSLWSSVDLNAVTLYGPNGVVLRDSGSACVFTLTPSGIAITGNVAITGTLTVTDNITASYGGDAAVDLLNHTHNVPAEPGSGVVSDAPNAGT